MKFASRIFLIAAAYGFLALLPQYFMEAKVGRDFPPPITHPEYFYGFVGVAIAWQWLFVLIARHPVRYRPAMLPGALEKLAFGAGAVVLYMQGRLATATLGFGIIDLVFAALFVAAYQRTSRA